MNAVEKRTGAGGRAVLGGAGAGLAQGPSTEGPSEEPWGRKRLGKNKLGISVGWSSQCESPEEGHVWMEKTRDSCPQVGAQCWKALQAW